MKQPVPSVLKTVVNFAAVLSISLTLPMQPSHAWQVNSKRAPGNVVNLSGSQLRAEDIVRAIRDSRPPAGSMSRAIRLDAMPKDLPEMDAEPPRAAPSKLSFDQIEFGFDSAAIRRSAYPALDEIGRALASTELAGMKFEIQGHTDAKGGFAYNIRLSRMRALAVGQYLSKRHGVRLDRLRFTGKGPTELLDLQQPESPVNRRVVIVSTT